MKDLVEISFTVNVKASPLAKGLTNPIAKSIEKLIPYAERILETYTKEAEAETEEKIRKQKA